MRRRNTKKGGGGGGKMKKERKGSENVMNYFWCSPDDRTSNFKSD